MYIRIKSKTCTTSVLNVKSITQELDKSVTIVVDEDVYPLAVQNLNNMGMTITEVKVVKTTRCFFKKSTKLLYKKINIKGYKELLIRS